MYTRATDTLVSPSRQRHWAGDQGSKPLLDFLKPPPPGNMRTHQCLEHAPVVAVAKMEQLMDDHEILKALVLVKEVSRQGDGACR